MLSNIPCLIPDTGNGRLTEPLPLSKLEPSFFRCELTVDGFTSKFFEPYRDIVGLDIVEAPMAFFQGLGYPRAAGCTHLILVSKIPNPVTFVDFSPLSMCNFFNKIISKCIANRMGDLLHKLISAEQSTFV